MTTSNIQYQITNNAEFNGASVLIDGEPYTVSGQHPDWLSIRDGLLNETLEAEELLELINPAAGVAAGLTRLSERVTFTDGTIFFDGDELDNSLTKHIIRIITESDSAERAEKHYKPFVAFLEKLYTNPSKKSRKHLYSFIESHGITITDNGDFIAYKGVNLDGTSSHRGYGIVNGVVYEHANLPNSIGAIVEIPRARVDDDRSTACSTGLHAGTHAYARSFAPRLLTVTINPRDVVSVPSDHSNAKIRVSRYVVKEIAPNEQYDTPSFTPAETENEFVSDAALAAAKGKSEATDFAARVDRMVDVIEALPADTNLRKFRNKKVTAKNREPFDEAVKALGLKYAS